MTKSQLLSPVLWRRMSSALPDRRLVPPREHHMPFKSRTDMYRAKALDCEQRAREVSDPTSKQDWEELAIEWHTMANFAARENPLIDSESGRTE